jgi:hypothetical protein
VAHFDGPAPSAPFDLSPLQGAPFILRQVQEEPLGPEFRIQRVYCGSGSLLEFIPASAGAGMTIDTYLSVNLLLFEKPPPSFLPAVKET